MQAPPVHVPIVKHPRFKFPSMDIFAAIVERIWHERPEMRNDGDFVEIRHRYTDDVYECVFQMPDGQKQVIEVMDPQASTFFLLDRNVCLAAPSIFHRGSGLKPKYDAMALLGLWSLAPKLPDANRMVMPLGYGMNGLRIEFNLGQLLRELRVVRSRYREHYDLPDFPANAWRDVKASLKRLAEVPVEFRYTIALKDGENRKRKPRIARRLFRGSLISIDVPDGLVGTKEKTAGKQEIVVTLNVYDGVLNKYYVLVSRCLFELRDKLDEIDTRVLLWLIHRHRGRNVRGFFLHDWRFRVDLDKVAGPDVLELRKGHMKEARERLRGSLKKLAELGVLKIDTEDEAGIGVELSRGFFHEEES
jgi:hypothetical protein